MLRDALLAALAKPDSTLDVVIVIPNHAESDAPIIADSLRYDHARYWFGFKDLIDNPRVHVLTIRDYYVHTKVMIVDDIFVSIGSANMNRRGLTHDAELNAFVLDGRVEDGVRKFARDLRTRLWSEHLGMPLTDASYSELNDVDRALNTLTNKRPPTARLIPYVFDIGDEFVSAPLDPLLGPIWDTFVDPIGS